MRATVEKVGPERAQLWIKELAPCFILVPVGELPDNTKEGDELELALKKVEGARRPDLLASANSGPLQPVTAEGVPIRMC